MILPLCRHARIKQLIAAAALTGIAWVGPAAADGEVNIYSLRQEVLIKPLLDKFAEAEKVKVNIVFVRDGLIERLKSEGANSPADVILTVDVANLIQARAADAFRAIKDAELEKSIPAQYRDPQGYWFGLSVRARPIIYSNERVKPEQLSTYADLADPKWKGKVCVRSSTHTYNLGMLSSFIAHDGAAKAEAWAKGFVANFARAPKGGDRDQIAAVAAGECDVALSNHYYLAGLATSANEKDRQVASKVRVFWPDQQKHGVHVNVSGAGIAKNAKNYANAVKLLRFLAGETAQKMYAESVKEYPVRAGVPPHAVVAAWGPFKADKLPLAEIGKHNPESVKIADRAGWR